MSAQIPSVLTSDDIDHAIVETEYLRPTGTLITLCILTLRNGARVVGHNYGPINPDRFNERLGREGSYTMAREKVWELEGYLLRQRRQDLKGATEPLRHPDPKQAEPQTVIIKPTVGRVVWYYPPKDAGGGTFALHGEADPYAATIASVWNDRMVNLSVLDSNGTPHPRKSVKLMQGDETFTPQQEHCRWMPFQIGQAKAQAAT